MLTCCTEVWVQVKRYITTHNLFSAVEALLLWTACKQCECTWCSACVVHKVLLKTDLEVKVEEEEKKFFRGVFGLFREVLSWICSWTYQSDYITSKIVS